MVNSVMTETNWQIGNDIVEFEQGGELSEDYGTALFINRSSDLKLLHDKRFSHSNLSRFRQFYLTYPNCAKASHVLSCSHYIDLLKLDDPLILLELGKGFAFVVRQYLPDRDELRCDPELTLRENHEFETESGE